MVSARAGSVFRFGGGVVTVTLTLAICSQSILAAPIVTPSERVRRNVVVRPQPGSAEKIDALDPGETAELLDQVRDHYHIKLNDGRTGYVSKSWTIVRDDGVAAAVGTQPLKVHVIDVGTGLATFIEGPGFTMMSSHRNHVTVREPDTDRDAFK